MAQKKVMLVILDGWGHGPKRKSDAIAQASIAFVNSLYQAYPNAELVTYGEEVGLPEGQMGNSEVGHLNIGAGRIVYQELARINKAIKDKELHHMPVLVNALRKARDENKNVHLFGLVSDGGVHSHINHVKALCDICTDEGLKNVFIHAFTDGRDTDPRSGYRFIQSLEKHIENQPIQLASIVGRYYAMDRDKRWERVKVAYDCLVNGVGEKTTEGLNLIQRRYDQGETDEFLMPIICTDDAGNPKATMKDGDLLICFNFRTDRPREISQVLTQKDMREFNMHKLNVEYLTMTRYDDTFTGIEVLFTKDDLSNTLGEVLSKENKTQVRIAETEKYPHVTFFFSGGREKEFEGERRLLIPSPKVATYDLQPEMSATEITDTIVKDIEENQPDFICLNYANADMVGHTGVFEAAKKAAMVVSMNLDRLIKKGFEYDYDAIVIADHGNSDYMLNEDDTPNTAHTMNPVPIFYISKNPAFSKVKNGKLADVAPTILKLMGVTPPAEMTGDVLVS
ncbi:MAG: 2,3-bisphosphoglycerate-independent phosphoglycerate mutase [Saprospiraceae bacterium]|nr:2,3-bisphosphoglycerate-independent phosphoglycerate mutase [Saprospiraceae bacterium]